MDCAFSLEPAELEALVQESERAWQALGQVRYGPTEAEQKSLVFRGSIYASANIAVGEVFTRENIRIVRPGHGAPPSLFNDLLGRTAQRTYTKGSPVKLDSLFR